MPVKAVAPRAALKSRGTNSTVSSARAARASSRSNIARATPADDSSPESEFDEAPQAKRRKTGKESKQNSAALHSRLFAPLEDTRDQLGNCAFPGRVHAFTYHRPLLLDSSCGRDGRDSLLKWFDSISTKRGMPWRKPWLGPMSDADATEKRKAYEKRAYEVWISEIMLQQTRVAVVIDYWNGWMAKWPTIQDLAAADADDVLAAWRGLGYYSRATRIHEAAKLVVSSAELDGLLPSSVQELEKQIPGVGRYTAGAISSIVFGLPEPMVDGNVLRVLSRQLGVLADVKTTKTVIDLLWTAADALVKAIAKDCTEADGAASDDVVPSDGPGRWGQALMELGSTVCTPKPNCDDCPISSTCKVFAEGQTLATKSKKLTTSGSIGDIEDMCTICEPFDDALYQEQDNAVDDVKSAKKGSKGKAKSEGQAKLTAFAFTKSSDKTTTSSPPTPAKPTSTDATLERAVNHAKLFPLKVVKKAVRQEETLVCAIRRSDGQYLIERRPEKGLLAGLWEFPSRPLTEDDDASTKARKQLARTLVDSLVEAQGLEPSCLSYRGELGSVPWVFSHLKLTMHVHLFDADVDDAVLKPFGSKDRKRWTADVEGESMGTGMRKCWSLVQAAEQGNSD